MTSVERFDMNSKSKKAGQQMKTKVRRRLVEQKIREFVDVARYVTDRPLLLWAPRIDELTTALVRAVTKIKERKLSCRKKPQEEETA
jgi:hypothetical protein